MLTQSAHSLRYVLKNRVTNEPYFVVVFTLEPKDGKGEDKKEKSKEIDNDLD